MITPSAFLVHPCHSGRWAHRSSKKLCVAYSKVLYLIFCIVGLTYKNSLFLLMYYVRGRMLFINHTHFKLTLHEIGEFLACCPRHELRPYRYHNFFYMVETRVSDHLIKCVEKSSRTKLRETKFKMTILYNYYSDKALNLARILQ